jgi:hypothetical protein
MQEQYIEGKFVNLKGQRAAYAFDRRKHTRPDIEKIPGHPVWVSIDFNVSPMAATLWNRLPFGVNYATGQSFFHELQAFDEICLESSNTYELCDAIWRKIDREDEVILYPDPAGVARSTKSRGLSDIDILRQGGFPNIKYKPVVSVRDTLNALNAKLSQDRIALNSLRCPNAIADLEQCAFRSGTFEIDKTNPKRSHWLDGLKNMVDLEFPIRGRGGFREQRIR